LGAARNFGGLGVMFKLLLSNILLLCILSSCSSLFGDKITLKKVSYDSLKGWENDDHSEALLTFAKSCKRYAAKIVDTKFHKTNIGGNYSNWQKICVKIADKTDPKVFFESNFEPYSVRNWFKTSGLFTGYYESHLSGSLVKKFPYIYPVYRTPPDLVSGKQYFSRAEIDSGVLAGKNLEILWVDNLLELFFMHIQGSGRVKLEDGSYVRLGYDSQNGHKYFAIGRYLLSEKYLEKDQISKKTIITWLENNPNKQSEILAKNPSYVFFREIKGEGPIGAEGVPLTAERSLAIDKNFIPYGAPIWLNTSVSGDINDGTPKKFNKLLIAQDTGGAIKGPVRGDIFFGYGDYAEKMAGYQNDRGRYFILLPRVGEL
jgi:membrane-bound lytic murein transglycosylase A